VTMSPTSLHYPTNLVKKAATNSPPLSFGKRAFAGGTALAVIAAALVSTAAQAQAATSTHGMGAAPPTRTVTPTRSVRPHVPSSVDLSAYAPSPGNQGAVGSCVTWAIGYGLMGWKARKAGMSGIDFAPMYIYSQINGGRDAGSSPIDATRLAISQGVDTRAHYTQGDFNWQTPPTTAERTNAAKYKVASTKTLFANYNGVGSAAQTAIQNELADGNPVAITVRLRQSFYSVSSSSPIYRDTTSGVIGYHEMFALGYDANGLRFQNSWGTGWGSGGRAYMTWDVVAKDVLEADTISGFASPSPTPAPTPKPTPTPTPTATPTPKPAPTPAPAVAKGTVYMVKTANTVTKRIEINSATAPSYTGGQKLVPTRFAVAEGANGVFQMIYGDLAYFKTKNTSSGKVEIHMAYAKNNYASGADGLTGLSTADVANGLLQVSGPNLVFIKTSKTASGKVELSFWNGSNGFAKPVSTAVTAFPISDAANGTFQVQGNDLVLIKTKGVTGNVEVRRATATSKYLTVVASATPFTTADAVNGVFSVQDVDGDNVADLTFLKTRNTSGKVQYYVANGKAMTKAAAGVTTWLSASDAASSALQVNNKQ